MGFTHNTGLMHRLNTFEMNMHIGSAMETKVHVEAQINAIAEDSPSTDR